MNQTEKFYLKELSDSASKTTECIRASMSGRVNSFILLISFIVLAEATISASMISSVFDSKYLGMFHTLCLIFICIAFIFIGIASYMLYRLYHGKLAAVVIPEELETPFCRDDPMKRDLSKFTNSEMRKYFGRPITEYDDCYSDIDLLYRRWVYQVIHALNTQYSQVEVLLNKIKISMRLTMASVVSLLLSGAMLFLAHL